nr:reverse transcriptase domain-containing protein [Tanacetum cinerariifolium]
MGIPNCIQNFRWLYTIPVSLWKSMSPSNRTRTQSIIGIKTRKFQSQNHGRSSKAVAKRAKRALLKIFSGKLKSRWSGPFTISEIYPYGTAKLIHPDGWNFKVNCHQLKHYHGGDPPPLEILDIHTFPKDN